MAKLSAHGYELLRISKVIEPTTECNECFLQFTKSPTGDICPRCGKSNVQPSLTTWERETKSYRSDGHIMIKRDVRFRNAQYDPRNGLHNYGWKLYKRIKKGADLLPEKLVANVVTRIRSNPDTKIKIEYLDSRCQLDTL
jgi:hypothetical protein